MAPPGGIDPTTYCTTSRHSTTELHSAAIFYVHCLLPSDKTTAIITTITITATTTTTTTLFNNIFNNINLWLP